MQVDKTDWKRHGAPAVVNAFYSSIENSIQFPAGILQVDNIQQGWINLSITVIFRETFSGLTDLPT